MAHKYGDVLWLVWIDSAHQRILIWADTVWVTGNGDLSLLGRGPDKRTMPVLLLAAGHWTSVQPVSPRSHNAYAVVSVIPKGGEIRHVDG